MRALVIGAAGFVGGHLVAHLITHGWDVTATKLPAEPAGNSSAKWHDLDILDADASKHLVEQTAPDAIFHLAAQSSVALGWKNPQLTVDINIKGAVNLLEALRGLKKQPRVLLVGSAEEYGPVRPEQLPVCEETPLHPGNVYAATKAAADMLGNIYAKAYGLNVLMVRAFNHFGPGQSPNFVVSDFCKQVAEIEAGRREPVMRVGNLEAKRDFTDVRDVVRAYLLLIEKGPAGQVYNVGSGQAVSIRQLLDAILQQARVPITVEQDPARMRPSDVPLVQADTTRLRMSTGWTPEIALEQTIIETLDWWREQVQMETTGDV